MTEPRNGASVRRSRAEVSTKQAGFTTESSVEDLYVWRNSQEYKDLFGADTTYRQNASISLIVAGFLLLGAIVLHPLHWLTETTLDVVLYTVQLLLVGLAILQGIGVAAKYVSARKSFFDRVRVRKAASVTETLESLNDPPTISELFRLNRKQLDEYHLVTVRQQKSAFLAAQVATAVSFVVLIVGAVISLRVQGSTPGDAFKTYVSGGLTALGTLLGSTLAATFFRSARETRDQLKWYYEEPYSTNRLLSVERIARTSPLESSDDGRRVNRKVWEAFITQLSTTWLNEKIKYEPEPDGDATPGTKGPQTKDDGHNGAELGAPATDRPS